LACGPGLKILGKQAQLQLVTANIQKVAASGKKVGKARASSFFDPSNIIKTGNT
jgi:hypothetical protein